MPTMSSGIQVFQPTPEGIQECREVMEAILESREPVALDAEGVSLSKTGRLTLLQFCTRDRHVYIVDLVNEKDRHNRTHGLYMMKEGKVKEVLENKQVLKITHGCANDQGALYHQFNVQLKNVFDTQCAHLALEYGSGHYFPRMLRLDKLCELYGTTTHATKDFVTVFRAHPKLWQERPLAQEALEYAANDVTILHELYEHLQVKIKEITQADFPSLLQEITEEELLSKVEEDRIQKAKRLRRRTNMTRALSDPRFLDVVTARHDIKLAELPEDFQAAVSSLSQYGGQFSKHDYPPTVWRLAEDSAKELLLFFNNLVERGEMQTVGLSHSSRIQRVRLKEMAVSGMPGHVQTQAKKFQKMVEEASRAGVAARKEAVLSSGRRRGVSSSLQMQTGQRENSVKIT